MGSLPVPHAPLAPWNVLELGLGHVSSTMDAQCTWLSPQPLCTDLQSCVEVHFLGPLTPPQLLGDSKLPQLDLNCPISAPPPSLSQDSHLMMRVGVLCWLGPGATMPDALLLSTERNDSENVPLRTPRQCLGHICGAGT